MAVSTQYSRRELLQGAGALALAMPLPLALPAAAFANSIVKSGEREVFTFSDGQLSVPMSIAADEQKPEALAAVLKAGGMSTDRNIAPLNVTAIRDGASYTFIDCGAGARFIEGSGKLASALEAANIDREKVERVIFTHAHPDHLWGALDEFDEPLFPNAKFMMPLTDRDFWMSADNLNKAPEDRKQFFAGAQRVIKGLGDRLSTFKAGDEVASGIMALDTSGHTPGHVSLEVKTGSESLIVLGDALTHPLISFQHPEWKPGSDQDKDRAIATRRKLLERLTAEKLRIIGYHLPGTGAGRAEKAGSAWRFVAG